MAYSLESLLKVLQGILQPHNQTCILEDNHHIELESLFQKVSSLKDLLENTSHLRGQQIEALESEIRDVSHEAEDIIEPNMVDPMLSIPNGTTFEIFPTNLSRVMEKFDAVIEKLTQMIKGQAGHDTIDAASSPLTVSDDSTKSTKSCELDVADSSGEPHEMHLPSNLMVGFEGDILQLKDRLSSATRKLQVIPIVGMGGIGKTTLARSLYDDSFIRSHFDARGWVTLSQNYSVRAILLDLLRCIVGKLSAEMQQESNVKLALVLHQRLCGQRYLVVVDDIWNKADWDEIKRFFPKEDHRSRILLTTRELNVGKYADPSCEPHEMHLLNHHRSWELFQHKAFGEEGCPPSLHKIGRRIASRCGGLPLAIIVIGGLLSENVNSRDVWDRVARDVSSFVVEKNKDFSKILTLSYNRLPYHLKPCFLYMAAFPEDCEVLASKVVSLLVAEGFVGSKKPEEEAAEEYIQALVNRNLLSVRRYKRNGKAKSYVMHDLLRELCTRKAREEKFLWVMNRRIFDNIKEGFRRASAHPSYQIGDVYASAEHRMPLARSFLCVSLASHEILSPMFFAMKLLRVLDVFRVKFPRFPREILQLVNLRFLALCVESDELPPEISRLRNLQTLIVKLRPMNSVCDYVTIPSELWDIPELRHFKMEGNVILLEDGCDPATQEKLQTLSFIALASLISSKLLSKIPNIKKLAISSRSESANLSHLHHLESLRCWGYPARTMRFWDLSHARYVPNLPRIEFPRSIRKLTLENYMMPRSFTSTVGSLPHLQFFKMEECRFDETGAEWEVREGEFGSLRCLELYGVNLMRWKGVDDDDDDDDAHFPRLRRLVVVDCDALEGIPSSFGDIAALEKIELDDSNPTLVASVRQFEEEQHHNGNESLQIFVYPVTRHA